MMKKKINLACDAVAGFMILGLTMVNLDGMSKAGVIGVLSGFMVLIVSLIVIKQTYDRGL